MAFIKAFFGVYQIVFSAIFEALLTAFLAFNKASFLDVIKGVTLQRFLAFYRVFLSLSLRCL